MTPHPRDFGEGKYFLALYHTTDHVLTIHWYSEEASVEIEWKTHANNRKSGCCFHERWTEEQVYIHYLAKRLEGEDS